VELPASPDRGEPACRHFGICGGCALQHFRDDAYAGWKVDVIEQALLAQGVTPRETLPMVRTAAGTRRRADFTLHHGPSGAIAGFARRASHMIVDVAECPVLMPQIVALLVPLRALVRDVLPAGTAAEAVVNWTDTGSDILLIPGVRLALDLDRRQVLSTFADTVDCARLCWGARRSAEPVVTRRTPYLRLGQLDVEPPPGAFLQASLAGEAALQAAVSDWLGPAKRVADLYGGVGTLSLGLVPQRRVAIFEGDRAAVAAVDVGVRKAGFGGAARAVVRDLARDPLPTAELDRFGAVIFDPPRAGAAVQAREIARSRVPIVIGVSCEPVSFARDARILIEGGYRLERLLPVDQFLWSAHVELAAVFLR
jgi:23S rRNA (uracil1939-C5)-methyltransferase